MNYRQEVLRTASNINMTNALMGLSSEAGEALDLLKKQLFQGHPADRDKMIKELGDVAWYFELACVCLNTTREEVEERNIAKLRARYPEKFASELSQNKNEEKE